MVLKYLYSQVYTNEIPNELSLGIIILGCDVHCLDCHSSHIWDTNCDNQGSELAYVELSNLIKLQSWVSCILFYGGEWKLDVLTSLLVYCKSNYTYKTALYSGRELSFFKDSSIMNYLDYLKVGKYDKQKGGLIYPSTNQRLYKVKNGEIDEDVTNLFWKTRIV